MVGNSVRSRLGGAPFVVQSSARSCTSDPPRLPPAVALPDAPTMLQDALMSCSSSERERGGAQWLWQRAHTPARRCRTSGTMDIDATDLKGSPEPAACSRGPCGANRRGKQALMEQTHHAQQRLLMPRGRVRPRCVVGQLQRVLDAPGLDPLLDLQ